MIVLATIYCDVKYQIPKLRFLTSLIIRKENKLTFGFCKLHFVKYNYPKDTKEKTRKAGHFVESNGSTILKQLSRSL